MRVRINSFTKIFFPIFVSASLLLTSCGPTTGIDLTIPNAETLHSEEQVMPTPTQRPNYAPGELVDYIAQTGDTLPALAARFNTTVDEIHAANPQVPRTASTMPPGFPMKIPIYFVPLWGPSYRIIPDSAFIYGPSSIDVDIESVIANSDGWLKDYSEPRLNGVLSAAEILTEVSGHFSISPMVFLTFLEVYASGLSDPEMPNTPYILGYESDSHKGVYMQTVWLANQLNNAYYRWRNGTLNEFEFPDGQIERPDPWLNASTVAIHVVLSTMVDHEQYLELVNQGGFDKVYSDTFGDPWLLDKPHIPVSLQQPYFTLPFASGRVWNYTGGPHAGWGDGMPFAAIDFAPSGIKSCQNSDDWVTAIADGLVLKSERGEVLIDMDMDGYQQTGWVVFYLHLRSTDRIATGSVVKQGDRIGHPSCEGGTSTGTHVHMARLYNGEWMLADGAVPFDLDGWVTHSSGSVYNGTMKKYSEEIRSSSKAENFSAIEAEPNSQ